MKCKMCGKDLPEHKKILEERFCGRCETKLAVMFREVSKYANK